MDVDWVTHEKLDRSCNPVCTVLWSSASPGSVLCPGLPLEGAGFWGGFANLHPSGRVNAPVAKELQRFLLMNVMMKNEL